jgi:hypothetical protein
MVPMRFALACAAVALVAIVATRPATQRLESEGGLPQFGMAMTADGLLLAAPDLEAGNKQRVVLRIERVAGDRIVSEARLSIGDVFFVPNVALHRNVLIATHDMRELWIFERRGTEWLETQRLVLGTECHAYPLDALTLGEDIAVVASADRYCVLERRGSRWEIATTIERKYASSVAISRKRVLLGDFDTIYQITHERDGWKRSAIAKAPKKKWYPRLAASDRWMVVEDDDGMLYIHDLDDRARLHTKITGRREDRTWIDIGPRILATAGKKGGHTWTFVNGRWKDGGLLDGIATRGVEHRVAVGDHVWIGDPDTTSFVEPGRVHLFGVR